MLVAEKPARELSTAVERNYDSFAAAQPQDDELSSLFKYTELKSSDYNDLDGNEHFTIQYAPDGVNFEVASITSMLPFAGGPFVPDAFADTGDGRGMYEAQVVDCDSRMQGLQGVGAIFGAIAPSVNAGKPGGEWQTYDITLVDRHVTVVLNGEKVIDNRPVPGPTAGAIHTNPAEPGPIYLQGDHTAVSYRNIYLAPAVTEGVIWTD
jgi:hypothetical protein